MRCLGRNDSLKRKQLKGGELNVNHTPLFYRTASHCGKIKALVMSEQAYNRSGLLQRLVVYYPLHPLDQRGLLVADVKMLLQSSH